MPFLLLKLLTLLLLERGKAVELSPGVPNKPILRACIAPYAGHCVVWLIPPNKRIADSGSYYDRQNILWGVAE